MENTHDNQKTNDNFQNFNEKEILPLRGFYNYLGLKNLLEIKKREWAFRYENEKGEEKPLSSVLEYYRHDKDLLLRSIGEIEAELTRILASLSTYIEDRAEGCGNSSRQYMLLLDERNFIECRYIYGYTMERTAEIMNVSRDTAYRINRRVRSATPTVQNRATFK